MKVYVSELPKNCDSCDIYKSYLGCCLTDFSRATPKAVRHNKCPLKSLAEHDKQVRKQVCEEIKENLRKQYPNVYANIGESLFCSDCYLRIRELSEILDKIGEEKC